MNIVNDTGINDSLLENNQEQYLDIKGDKSRSTSPLLCASPATSTHHLPATPIPPPAEFSDSAVIVTPVTNSPQPTEILVEVTKGSNGLGLSIVGGSDTPLGCVLIHEIYPNGAAAASGKLKSGDQILEVNGRSIRETTHSEAIESLRQSFSVIQLLVCRAPIQTNDDSPRLNKLDIELHKKTGRGLGLSIVGKSSAPGVYISEVLKGGIADGDGRFLEGDQILRVNGQDLSQASQEFAAAFLKTTMGKINITLGRLQPCSHQNNSRTFPNSKSP